MITSNKVESRMDKKPKISPFISTKTVDVGLKEAKAPDPRRTPDKSMTTTKIGDPADIAERLKRQEVMKQKAKTEEKLRMARAKAVKRRKK